MAERKIVKCKGCGADIFFEQGTPWFARKTPVLICVPNISGADELVKTTGYVSHFVNCQKANDFSRGKADRKNEGAQ